MSLGLEELRKPIAYWQRRGELCHEVYMLEKRYSIASKWNHCASAMQRCCDQGRVPSPNEYRDVKAEDELRKLIRGNLEIWNTLKNYLLIMGIERKRWPAWMPKCIRKKEDKEWLRTRL